MTPIVWTYIVYIALSIPLTIWVAQTLHKNGRVFLIDSFRGNERLAASVNHLLVVGFYLINIGYVALGLKERIAPTDVREVLETVSRKIGVVMLVLGVMHFFNILVFSKMRRRNLLAQQPAFLPLVFIAFQSDEAQRRFPGIDGLKPEEQLLVISDEGAVYLGAHAWIICLWPLE